MAYGKEQHELARLLDFRQSSSNHFLAVKQLNAAGRRGRRIPDVLLFINGLPLVIFELKNPLDENAGLHRVFNQLQTYQEDIADLFVFNQIQVINADSKGEHIPLRPQKIPLRRVLSRAEWAASGYLFRQL